MVPLPVPSSASRPLIPEFFAGREVFITGATGFIGKVLVERLLWTCPDIQSLHLLLRWKKDISPDKRLAQLKQSKVFDVVRARCPQQLDKLCAVVGDVTEPRLGINRQHIRTMNQVSVVFHSAATVKFDEPLAAAVEQNVRSVVKVMDICDELPNMQAFIHVSTAYSNAELNHVEERVYPSCNVEQLLSLVDAAPQDVLAEITPRLIAPKPNTYTFTKALAESVVARRGSAANYSAAIFRPSIVISSLRDPFPGWIENLNGLSGVVVATGQGLLHVFSAREEARADMTPVDIVIDTLIAVAWETGIERSNSVRVYNCSSCEHPTTWGQFKRSALRGLREYPFSSALWYPSMLITRNSFVHRVTETALHTLPLHAVDYIYKLCGVKPQLSLSTVSKRLHALNEALKFFSLKEWSFDNDNLRRLWGRLAEQDRLVYNLDPKTIDWHEHTINFVKGTRKYLLREKDEDMENARRRMFIFYMLHNVILFGFLLLVCWILLLRVRTVICAVLY